MNLVKGMAKKLVGRITHFYPNISVAVVELKGTLKQGDKIAIQGKSNFEQQVSSMQIDNKPVKEAKAKQSIGLKIVQPAMEKDLVYTL